MIKEKLLKGYAAGGRTYKVHLDGYDLGPYFRFEAKEPPRKEFLYWNDDGKLVALRYTRWKQAAEQPVDEEAGRDDHQRTEGRDAS